MSSADSAKVPPRTAPKGTVYLAYSPDNDPPLSAHWDAGPGELKELPQGLTVWEATQWACERAARVILRFDHPLGGGMHWRLSGFEGAPEVEFYDPRITRDDAGNIVRVGALVIDENYSEPSPPGYIPEFKQEADDGA